MMFWKFQTQRTDAAEPAATPVFVPAAAPASPPPPVTAAAPAQPREQFIAPAVQPDLAQPVQPQPVQAQAVQPAALPSSYTQAAQSTMQFLAGALQLPSWVLFKNASGILSVVTGIGEFQRYLPVHELSVGRLSDLPTVNLLGAAPPMSANGGIDRRQGGIDPATVAPFGVPLVDIDGNLFGILCAFGERNAVERVANARGLLDYAVSMLGAVVRTELTLEEATRRTERAQADALVDPLTGLHNRRAWDQLLATEDQRCNRHGYDAVVFVIDLDGLKAVNDRFGHEKGDELIKNAATALERCVRRTDVVARVGGDEFSILAVKCDANAAARIREHIESTLLRANASATVGFSVRSEAGDLFEAWRQADGAMYHRKRGNPRRGQRATDENVAQPTAPVTAAAPPATAAAPAATPVAPLPPSLPEQAASPSLPQRTPAATQPQAAPPPVAVETSVVTQILEKVLPALVSGLQKAAPAPAPPPPPPTPIFAAPQTPPTATRPLIVPGEAEIPTYTPPPAPPPTPAQVVQPAPAPIVAEPPAEAPVPQPEPAQPQPQPQPQPSQPSEDLIDIVSRLSRLSDADRRLLDVFFKGSR
jgi:diguanylate cyclase (GGDEF)-like protein